MDTSDLLSKAIADLSQYLPHPVDDDTIGKTFDFPKTQFGSAGWLLEVLEKLQHEFPIESESAVAIKKEIRDIMDAIRDGSVDVDKKYASALEIACAESLKWIASKPLEEIGDKSTARSEGKSGDRFTEATTSAYRTLERRGILVNMSLREEKLVAHEDCAEHIKAVKFNECTAHDLFNGDLLDFTNRNLLVDDLDRMERRVSDEKCKTQLKSILVRNNRFTDEFLSELLGDCIEGSSMHAIDISNSSNQVNRTVETLSLKLKSLQLTSLRTLSISGMNLSGPALAELTNNLNPSTTPVLYHLDLSDTGLGRWDDIGCDSLAFTLVQIRSLNELNISRNFLRPHQLSKIGESLANMDSIAVLNVSFNSDSTLTGLPGITSLCSLLGSVASLKAVFLSRTGMNDEAAFVLADSLCMHPKIAEIDLSDNPNIGIFGMRSLLKLLFFNEAIPDRFLRVLNLGNCLNSTNRNFFSFSDPSGDYVLRMDNLFHKSIARQCLRVWEISGQTFKESFLEFSLDGSANYKPEKDNENVWQLPDNGVLSFTAVFRQGKDPKKVVITQELLARFINGVYSTLHSVENRARIIEAISLSYAFHCDISALIDFPGNSVSIKSQILGSLLLNCSRIFPIIAKCKELLQKNLSKHANCGNEKIASHVGLWFNLTNPTGPYELNVSIPEERTVAQTLLNHARSEFEACKNRIIVSFRNPKLNGVSFEFSQDWQLPSNGTWEVDFVSPFRFKDIKSTYHIPPSLETEAWKRVSEQMHTIASSGDRGGPEIAFEAMRKVSSRFYINCSQLADFLRLFMGMKKFQLDLICILVRRVTDYPDLKEMLCRVRMGLPAVLDASDVLALEARLGKLNLLNPLRAENTSFVCDFSDPEGRKLAKIFLRLLEKEKGSRVINSRFIECIDGKGRETSMNPPSSWNALLPLTGVWSATYVSEEKKANKELRKALAVQYCGFDPRSTCTVTK